MKERIEPVARFPLECGQRRNYEGIRIVVASDGEITANGKRGKGLVSFNRQHGLATMHCIALFTEGQVMVFEGNTLGPGMISEEQVKRAYNI